MQAAVRRGLRGADRLGGRLQELGRGVAGSATEAAALAAGAQEFAEQYPKLKVKVNGKEVQVPAGSSILTACRLANAYVSEGERLPGCEAQLVVFSCTDGAQCNAGWLQTWEPLRAARRALASAASPSPQ